MNTFTQLKLTVNVLEHVDQELTLLTHRNMPIDTLRELHKTRELLIKELVRLAKCVSIEQVDKAILRIAG